MPRRLLDRDLRRLSDVAGQPDLGTARYEIRERIGEGGMGTVYSAWDRSLDREVALKVLRLPEAGPGVAARLMREAKILAGLEHPGIVPVHEAGETPDGRVWYAMRLVRGERLDRHAAALTDPASRLRLFLRICEIVAYAHARGVVHRDLKPQNIMAGPFGEVLVLDWGAAKGVGVESRPGIGTSAEDSRETPRGAAESGEVRTVAEDRPIDAGAAGAPVTVSADGPSPSLHTREGIVLGTPGFMAPEQERGEAQRIGPHTDVYALGRLFRRLVCGSDAEVPGAAGGTLASGRRDRRRLEAILSHATAERPEDRYPDAGELAADLRRLLSGLPVRARSEGSFERLVGAAERHRTPILLILAYLVMRAALLVVAGD